MEWDFNTDTVTVWYDAKKSTPENLAQIIRNLQFTVQKTDGPKSKAPVTLERVLVPEDSPAFFRQTVARAQKENRPLVIDFWAKWCAPCVRLKRETLQSPIVAKALERFEFVEVDVDNHPELAKAYGVSAIPDVAFVDREGYVYDRLRAFETPKGFLPRLERESMRRLIELSPDATELRESFNAAKGKVRLLLIVSPG